MISISLFCANGQLTEKRAKKAKAKKAEKHEKEGKEDRQALLSFCQKKAGNMCAGSASFSHCAKKRGSRWSTYQSLQPEKQATPFLDENVIPDSPQVPDSFLRLNEGTRYAVICRWQGLQVQNAGEFPAGHISFWP